MLSVIEGMKHFRNIILGSKITVFTDNRNNIFCGDPYSNRIQRWLSIISEFDYTIEFIFEKDNAAADFLSRNLLNQPIESTVVDNDGAKFTLDENKIMTFLNNLHIYLGHPSFFCFYKTMKEIIQNRNLYKLCQIICSDCQICPKIRHRKLDQKTYKRDLSCDTKDDTISIDICGPCTIHPTGSDPYKIHFLTSIDHHSRLVRVGILRNITARETTTVFNRILLSQVTPRQIISDNGTQFTSREFRNLMTSKNIIHTFTRPYNPQANSKSERIDRAINEIMRVYDIQFTPTEIINIIEARLNKVYNRSIGCSPYELHYNMNALNENISTPENIQEKANEKTKQTVQYDKSQKNQNKKPFNIRINDMIYVRTTRNKKQQTLFEGPFTVTEVNINKNGIRFDNMRNKPTWVNARNAIIWKRAECRDDVHQTAPDQLTSHQNTSVSNTDLETINTD